MASDAREEKPMTAIAEPEVMAYTFAGKGPAGPLTAADLPDIDLDVPFEIHEGELVLMPPPSPWHSDTAFNIQVYLRPHHSFVTADVPVEIGEDVRRPDVVGLSASRTEVVGANAATLAVNVVEVAVEIISHDRNPARDRLSVRRDRETKFHEYAAAGIPEYWIVDRVADDPLDASIEMYRLKDGAYAQIRVVRLSELLAAEVTAE
jgi:Uma2 family endonuclease